MNDLECPKCHEELDEEDIEFQFKHLTEDEMILNYNCPNCDYAFKIEREIETFYYIKEEK